MKIQTIRGIERDSAIQNITAIKKGKTRSQECNISLPTNLKQFLFAISFLANWY